MHVSCLMLIFLLSLVALTQAMPPPKWAGIVRAKAAKEGEVLSQKEVRRRAQMISRRASRAGPDFSISSNLISLADTNRGRKTFLKAEAESEGKNVEDENVRADIQRKAAALASKNYRERQKKRKTERQSREIHRPPPRPLLPSSSRRTERVGLVTEAAKEAENNMVVVEVERRRSVPLHPIQQEREKDAKQSLTTAWTDNIEGMQHPDFDPASESPGLILSALQCPYILYDHHE